jgi:hypothetical protein
MIDNKIHDKLHATLLDFLYEVVDVGECAITRVDIFIICDVVPHVGLRALVN